MKRTHVQRIALFFLLVLTVLIAIPVGKVALALPPMHCQQTSTLAPAHSKDLLEIATRTAITVSPEVDSETYFWVSDKQVLFVRPDPAHRQFRVVLVDAQTGAKTLPAAFNTLASPRMPVIEKGTLSYEGIKQVIHLYPPPSNALSPDGKWLLWCEGYPVISAWWAATLDGEHHHEWKAAQGSSEDVFWLPGGRDWIEVVRQYDAFSRLLIHPFSPGEKSNEIRLSGVGDAISVGMTNRKTVLVRYLNLNLPEYRSYVEMAEIGIRHKVEQAHRFSVRLPKPVEVAYVTLSPNGDKLAWFLSLPKSETGEVWLSDSGGRQMRMLGRLTGTGAWHRTPHWLPDGKHLSFEDQYSIWTVPVP